MKTPTKLIIALAAVAVIGAGAFAYKAQAAPAGGHFRDGFFAGKFAELNLTADQRTHIRAIFAHHLPASRPKLQEFVTARRELKKLIHAEKVDEAAIRAQVAKMAAVGADLAVERARVAQEIRPLLTPEQIEKLRDMASEAEARADGIRAYVAKRIAND